MRTKHLLTSAFIDQTCSAWPFPPSDAASFNTSSIIYSCTNFMSWKFSFPTIYQSGWYPNFATSPKSNRYGLSWPRMQPCSLVTFLLFFILPVFVASNEIVYITLCNGFSTFRRPSATACRSPNLFRLCFAAWLLNTLLKFATRDSTWLSILSNILCKHYTFGGIFIFQTSSFARVLRNPINFWSSLYPVSLISNFVREFQRLVSALEVNSRYAHHC